MTQADVGKGLGTDGKDAGKAVVYGWERDQHQPRADQLILICQRLGVSADHLLFGVSDLSPEARQLVSELDAVAPDVRPRVLAMIRDLMALTSRAPPAST
jgi:transcriptional regulator with XRE-family HTH domain